jgi:hypothetical protein
MKIERGTLLVGPLFEKRPVEDLTRDELVEMVYELCEQSEGYLAEIKRCRASMRETMAAVAGSGR